jgi:hypothetical protein
MLLQTVKSSVNASQVSTTPVNRGLTGINTPVKLWVIYCLVSMTSMMHDLTGIKYTSNACITGLIVTGKVRTDTKGNLSDTKLTVFDTKLFDTELI